MRPLPPPFDPDTPGHWAAWRERKLEQAPSRVAELIVEIRDPFRLTPAEKQACLTRLQRNNWVCYATAHTQDDPSLPCRLSEQFGLTRLDANWLAGEDGLSRIEIHPTPTQVPYIPYTNWAIKWHTDGYYNPPKRLIRAMTLHCVRPARDGGVNRVMDPEMAYLALRDQNPEHIRALMQPDVMTLPPREEGETGRPAQTGPVFSVDDQGQLHLRYTARTRSIQWKDGDTTQAARQALEQLLAQPDHPAIFTLKLEAGMGLLSNNVLHDRSAFIDDPDKPRLLYRARYLERIASDPTC